MTTLPKGATITMLQSPFSGGRTSRGIGWYCETVVAGEPYHVLSRSGAPQALARVLVRLGVPDRPVMVFTQGIKGHTSYRSLHAMAGRAIEESASVPVHSIRYRPHPGNAIAKDGPEPQDGPDPDER